MNGLPEELRGAGEDLPPRRKRPVWHRVLAAVVVAAMLLSVIYYSAAALL
ncbi:hypothetical protein ATJ97_1659 [Georgenia soli]|uniref:Uncharacterized protein n=1 Tax=Georgenia soli TaxID=638953 RepID=A0A2A9EJP5_9MICO|nr:hypothetical protein [Georgenia soli]PFG39164.1 hypothetical protein ATJ97_1659 [Georgenia soli]